MSGVALMDRSTKWPLLARLAGLGALVLNLFVQLSYRSGKLWTAYLS